MSGYLQGAVWRVGPEKFMLRATLAMLADQADDFGFACPGMDTIAVSCKCDERTVIRRIASLERDGWIEVKRKVISARGNVYFINLDKLGVTPPKNARRSPLWADIQRLMRALRSGDKVSLRNRVLQFEKPADDAGRIVTGSLFEDEEPGDTLSPESVVSDQQNGTLDGRGGTQSPEAGQNEPPEALAGQNPGDSLSPVTRQPDHLSGDIWPSRVKTLPVTTPVSSPLPPEGAAGSELPDGYPDTARPILPFADCTVADPGFGMAVGVAARWVMDELGIAKQRVEAVIAAALRLDCQQRRSQSLQTAAAIAVANYRLYLEQVELMRFGPWSPAKFFGEGWWAKPQAWPYDQERMARSREAKVGRWRPS